MLTLANSIYRFFYPERNSMWVRSEYGIPERISLSVNLNNGWFVATSPELPGLITQAKSQEELLDNVNDAILSYFDVPKRISDCVFEELSIDFPQTGTAVVRKKQAQTALA